MSAEIRPFPGSASSNKRLELVAKLEGHQEVVNFAILLKNEEGVISTGDDKLVYIHILICLHKNILDSNVHDSCINSILTFFFFSSHCLLQSPFKKCHDMA